MRLLVTSHPGLGHVNGIIELSAAFRHAGHDVLVAGSPSVVGAFRRAGLPGDVIVDEPPGSDSQETLDLVAELRTTPAPQRLSLVHEHVGVRARSFPLVDALTAVVESWKPQVFLRDETEFAGWVVAERAGIPDVSFGVSAHWSPQRWNAEVGGALADLRRHAGLETTGTGPAATLSGRLHINNAPPSLRDPTVQLPADTVHLMPSFFEGYGPAATLPEGARGHAYLAFGSVYNPPGNAARTIVDALSDSFETVVAAGVTSTRPNVVARPFLRQTPAMAGCAVVVCHGGRNTVLTALRHGVPVVCVPMGSDHFDISRFVRACGAGVEADWNTAHVVDAAVRVATDDRHRLAASRVAAEIADMPRAGHVIERVVALAGGARSHPAG